jgi:lipopolysaccharide biosynthesis glycosyltransferase
MIHIAVSCDNNYTAPFYVLLTSILHNNKENDLLFHIIVTGVNEEERNNIQNFIEQMQAAVIFL